MCRLGEEFGHGCGFLRVCVCGGVYACGCPREVGKRDMVTVVIICIVDLVF